MFYTFPSFEIEAIAGLIPINLHLCKLSGHAQLRAHSHPHNHILKSLLELRSFEDLNHYPLSLDSLTHCQRENIKDSIIDMDNRFNKVLSSFDLLNVEFSPSFCLIDIFPSCFSFHPYTKHKDYNFEDYTNQLNNIVISSSLNLLHALIILDTKVKNNVAMSITHIHVHDRSIVKMIYHTANITSTEAELFAIRYGINQMTNLPGILKIIVITDSIHAARSIFDSSIHLLQVYSAAISKELREIFSTNSNNLIEFWKCSSQCD